MCNIEPPGVDVSGVSVGSCFSRIPRTEPHALISDVARTKEHLSDWWIFLSIPLIFSRDLICCHVGNKIGDRGVRALAAVLKENGAVADWDLSGVSTQAFVIPMRAVGFLC